MTDQLALHTPFAEGEAIDLGAQRFRKQILRVGELDYMGRKLKFDRRYMEDLAESFRAGAFDQVPLQLAGPDNAHTEDPERYRGQLVDVAVTDDGLDGVFEVGDKGADLIRENPRLGVSARLVNGVEQMHGRFGPAIRHVLATLDPRVTRMRPWEAVSLSNPSLEVIDLTDQESTMPESTNDTPTLTDEDRAKFGTFLSELEELAKAGDGGQSGQPAGGGGDEGSGEELTPEQEAALDAELDAELERIAQGEPATAGASLSNDGSANPDVVELARAQAEEARNEVAALRRDATMAKADRELAELRAQGVPPAALDLARPFLVMGQDREPVTVDLSAFRDDAGTSLGVVDLAGAVRKLLALVPRLDLSGETLPAPGSPGDNFGSSIRGQMDELFGAIPKANRRR